MTKEFALINTTARLLNNHKWYSIFDRLDDINSVFELKILLSNDIKICHHIQELEKTSILIDDSGDYIEFLEIDRLRIKKTNELMTFLEELNVEFIEQEEYIDIEGYRKK
jgi:hypothetical protein